MFEKEIQLYAGTLDKRDVGLKKKIVGSSGTFLK